MHPTFRQDIETFHLLAQPMSATARARLSRDYGITHRSILLDLPTIDFPRSFPVDTMHCMALNITKALFRLWVPKKKAGKPWELSPASLQRIGDALTVSRKDVPAAVGTSPNSTES